MAYGIVELLSVAAHNVDAYNHTFVNTSDDIENGSIFTMGDRITGQEEEYTAVKPATANLAKQFYMAASPIRTVTELADGSKFVDLSPNPKAFINKAGQPIDGVALKLGDIVRLSVDAVAGTKSTNTFVVATNDAYKLTWAAAAISGLSLKLIGTSYVSVADGFGSQRVVAYDFRVDAIA